MADEPMTIDRDILHETASRLDWVRPIAGFMRLQGIPEAVVQKSMTSLLDHLTNYLDEGHKP